MPATNLPYVTDPTTGKSRTREFLQTFLSSAGGAVELPDGSNYPAMVGTVLDAKVPQPQKDLYVNEPKKFEKTYIGRASKVASSSNSSELLWCIIADVSKACNLLSPRERAVLKLRYFEDYRDDKVIATTLNLTVAEVAELERSALDRLVATLDLTE